MSSRMVSEPARPALGRCNGFTAKRDIMACLWRPLGTPLTGLPLVEGSQGGSPWDAAMLALRICSLPLPPPPTASLPSRAQMLRVTQPFPSWVLGGRGGGGEDGQLPPCHPQHAVGRAVPSPMPQVPGVTASDTAIRSERPSRCSAPSHYLETVTVYQGKPSGGVFPSVALFLTHAAFPPGIPVPSSPLI